MEQNRSEELRLVWGKLGLNKSVFSIVGAVGPFNALDTDQTRRVDCFHVVYLLCGSFFLAASCTYILPIGFCRLDLKFLRNKENRKSKTLVLTKESLGWWVPKSNTHYIIF